MTEQPSQTTGAFAGKLVAVTGAAGGIGQATARRLHAGGARLVLLDWDAVLVTEVAAEFDALGLALDVSDSTDVDQVFAQIATRYGRLDGLVHVAGIPTDAQTKERLGPQLNERFSDDYPAIEGIVRTTDEQWSDLMKVNLDGTFYCLRAALRIMTAQRSGSIVTISSNAALVGEPGTAAYSASKAGARILTQAAAAEAIGFGVRVNSVAPGPTMTRLVAESAKAGQKFLNRIPARRAGRPDEIAAAVCFLLGDDAEFVVGETLNVNGGIVMR